MVRDVVSHIRRGQSRALVPHQRVDGDVTEVLAGGFNELGDEQFAGATVAFAERVGVKVGHCGFCYIFGWPSQPWPTLVGLDPRCSSPRG